MTKIKYLGIFILFAFGILGMILGGYWSFLLPFEAFFLVPLFELILQPSTANLEAEAERKAAKNPIYDFFLYLVVPFQFALLIFFLSTISSESAHWSETMGKTWGMGIACGVLGINVGHELGHRKAEFPRFLAKLLLLSSLYMHFYIEHNRGHHKQVGTKEDPASARFGEPVYLFWLRSISMTYLSAWKIEANQLRKKGRRPFSIYNEMIWFQLIQLAFVFGIYSYFGLTTMLLFLAAAGFGILLLETVNYIEHYGLQRRRNPKGKYERVRPAHSWNSDHILGRVFLFELSRHSDHHYQASRPYQILRHLDDSPQLPTGYPGMMLLALIPPIWFRTMHKRIRDFDPSMIPNKLRSAA